MTPEQFKTIRAGLPTEPGIYKYFNEQDEIIYIGKAKDLKKRVSTYFMGKGHTFRIQRMIAQIHRLEFTIVDTEQDAFLLENSLIKQYQPRYNVLLRDDKTYPFICITNEPFPQVFFTRNIVRNGSEYLGPYASAHNAAILLTLLKSIIPIRTCQLNLSDKNIAAGKFKVCLEYHLKNCMGPCQGLQSKEDYEESIQQIREILKSNFGSVLYYLKKKMNEYAANFQYERANEVKEKIALLTDYQSRSTIVNPKLTNLDVYGYAETETTAFVNYLRIGNGTIIQSRSIEIKRVLDEPKEELLLAAVREHSMHFTFPVDEIILPFPIEWELENIKINVPLRFEKKKLLDLATKNALYVKQERVKQSRTMEEKKPSFRIMKTLKEDLRLKDLPVHIECFDNSNIQGTNAVAAMVCFKNAAPAKKEYRHFLIKTVEGANDFASMEEIIYRRYKRLVDEGQSLPQLIIVDGGKGQLSAAVKSLEKLELYGVIPIVGIAKKLEEIYFPEDSIPLYINKKSESLKLIQRMRDEAHRFGITHHRNKRSKTFLQSDLISIKGIGEKTMELLLKKYKSVKKIKEATLTEVEALIGKQKSKILFNHFNSPELNFKTKE